MFPQQRVSFNGSTWQPPTAANRARTTKVSSYIDICKKSFQSLGRIPAYEPDPQQLAECMRETHIVEQRLLCVYTVYDRSGVVSHVVRSAKRAKRDFTANRYVLSDL